jgi:hypothetical protein
MSIYTRLIKGLGRVVAVYRLSGMTYVEVAPTSDKLWDAICARIYSMSAVPVMVRGD